MPAATPPEFAGPKRRRASFLPGKCQHRPGQKFFSSLAGQILFQVVVRRVQWPTLRNFSPPAAGSGPRRRRIRNETLPRVSIAAETVSVAAETTATGTRHSLTLCLSRRLSRAVTAYSL